MYSGVIGGPRSGTAWHQWSAAALWTQLNADVAGWESDAGPREPTQDPETTFHRTP